MSKRLQKDKSRIEYIDIARGIAILLMIVGHAIKPGLKYAFIFSFHMPLFIIVSGFFYRDKSFKSTLLNIIKKLIVPYVLCAFIVNYLVSLKIYGFTYAYIGRDTINTVKELIYSYTYWGGG